MKLQSCLFLLILLKVALFTSCVRKNKPEVVFGEAQLEKGDSHSVVTPIQSLNENTYTFFENEKVLDDRYVGEVELGDVLVVEVRGIKKTPQAKIAIKNSKVQYSQYECINQKCFNLIKEKNCEYQYTVMEGEKVQSLDLGKENTIQIYLGDTPIDISGPTKLKNGRFQYKTDITEQLIKENTDLYIKFNKQNEKIIDLGFIGLGKCDLPQLLVGPKLVGDTRKYQEKVVDKYEYHITVKVIRKEGDNE